MARRFEYDEVVYRGRLAEVHKVGVRLRLSVVIPDHGLVPLEELVVSFHDTDPLVTDSVSLLAV